MSPHNAGEEHDRHVLGGYKATISNPNTSEAAKDHAREVLDQIAEDSAPPDHASVSAHIVPQHVEHENRVLGGYKASLSNPNTSAEAKAHAEEVLGGYTAKQPSAEDVKHEHRVLGGYKATLRNVNVSDEAKEHAREMLAQHGEKE